MNGRNLLDEHDPVMVCLTAVDDQPRHAGVCKLPAHITDRPLDGVLTCVVVSPYVVAERADRNINALAVIQTSQYAELIRIAQEAAFPVEAGFKGFQVQYELATSRR